MSTKIVDVTDDDFEAEVLDDELPVLVDFYKDDCESCDLIAPTFKAIAKEFAGRVKFVKAHADSCGESEAEAGVEGYPTLTLFIDGEKVEEVPWNPGLPTEKDLREFLERHLEEDDDEDEDDDEEEEDDE